jgi:nicotinamide mononucleotide transporter
VTFDPVEVVGFILTVVSIWLATKENIWYYPTGLVALVAYTAVYFQARLYAESLLQVAFFALMVYGWYEWLHGGADRKELPVTSTPRWAWAAGMAAGLAASALTIWIQLRYTDNPAPWVDSSLFAWSLVAQWMTARKWIESWIFWLVINTVSIPLYISRGLWLTTVLFIALWILAILGYREWRRTLIPAPASA